MGFSEHIAALWTNAVEIFLEAIPYLGFGFFIAGFLHAFISNEFIARHLRKESIWVSIKAAILGTPIPLCSCSVIPVTTELRRSGASRGALTSFLISAPVTSVDSLLISYAILGPIMTVVRLIASLCTAIITACLVMWTTLKLPMRPIAEPKDSCCSATAPLETQSTKRPSVLTRFIDGQRYAFTTLLDDSFKWVLLALIATTVINTHVPHDFFTQYGDGLLAMLVMVAVGFPMYICASASTPIAAGLLLMGISPGAVLVFILVGPASNVATIGVVNTLINKRASFVYLVGVTVVSIAAGLMLNQLVAMYSWDILAEVRQVAMLSRPVAITVTALVFLASIKKLRPYIGLVKKT